MADTKDFPDANLPDDAKRIVEQLYFIADEIVSGNIVATDIAIVVIDEMQETDKYGDTHYALQTRLFSEGRSPGLFETAGRLLAGAVTLVQDQ